MVFVKIRSDLLFSSHFNLTATPQPFTLYGLLALQKDMVSPLASHNDVRVRDALYP